MILQGNCLEILKTLDEGSVNCCVTSPPYFGLRCYGTNPVLWPAMTYSIMGFEVSVPEMTCELGHEQDPKYFVGHLVLIFREVKRVLKDDGTCWINMGDSYANPSTPGGGDPTIGKRNLGGKKYLKNPVPNGCKAKDLIGIPWMMAFALRDDGWYLRQDVIWSKPNCMPESVTDRCTKSHEYVFMFSKSKKYYYDHEAIKTEAKESSIQRASQDTANLIGGIVPGKSNGNMKAVLKNLPDGQSNIRKLRDKQRGHSREHAGFKEKWDQMSRQEQMSVKANKRSVWHVSTAQYREDHFAVFPELLIWDMVKASCPEGGVVIDPFFGRGTTGVVAAKQFKKYIGIEMLPKNVALAKKYLYEQLGFEAALTD